MDIIDGWNKSKLAARRPDPVRFLRQTLPISPSLTTAESPSLAEGIDVTAVSAQFDLPVSSNSIANTAVPGRLDQCEPRAMSLASEGQWAIGTDWRGVGPAA